MGAPWAPRAYHRLVAPCSMRPMRPIPPIRLVKPLPHGMWQAGGKVGKVSPSPSRQRKDIQNAHLWPTSVIEGVFAICNPCHNYPNDIQISMDFRGYPCISIDFRGNLWISTEISIFHGTHQFHGNQWLSMRYQRISVEIIWNPWRSLCCLNDHDKSCSRIGVFGARR